MRFLEEEEEEEADITESSQPTSAQPPSASKEGEDDDVEISDVGGHNLTSFWPTCGIPECDSCTSTCR